MEADSEPREGVEQVKVEFLSPFYFHQFHNLAEVNNLILSISIQIQSLCTCHAKLKR